MTSRAKEYVDSRIKRNKKTFSAYVASVPSLKSKNGVEVHVVDLIVKPGSQPMRDVPIAHNNKNISNTVQVGDAVQVESDDIGRFQVIGRSMMSPGNRTVKKYSIDTLGVGIGFSQGLIRQTDNTYKSGGNDNTIDTGTDDTEEETFTTRPLTYGELSPYGSHFYGEYILEQSTS